MSIASKIVNRLLAKSRTMQPEQLDLAEREAKSKASEKANQAEEEANTILAERFVERFELYVEEGIMKRRWLETAPIGDCEEPGWRQHRLTQIKEWIPVYNFKAEFIGQSTDSSFYSPPWMKKALVLLKDKGWDCQICARIDVEVGIGNHHLVELCIRQQQSKKSN